MNQSDKRIFNVGCETDQHGRNLVANAFFLTAKVTVDGKAAVRFEFACTAADME